MSNSTTPILIFGVLGFFIGLLVGEFVQAVVMSLFPEVTSAIVNACPVEGPWGEVQSSVIDTTRAAIDLLFGVGGAVSLVGLMGIFGGSRS